MAGGGIKGGQTIGQTDDIGWNVVEDRVHVNDLHATILHQFGFDHTKLTYRFQGRDFRLDRRRRQCGQEARRLKIGLAAGSNEQIFTDMAWQRIVWRLENTTG